MASALLDPSQWEAELAPLHGLGMPRRGKTGPLRPGTGPLRAGTAPLVAPMPAPAHRTGPLTAPLPEIAPQPAVRTSKITKTLTAIFVMLAAGTVGIYLHTLNIEGNANRQRQEIRKLKEGNHYLQVQLAQTTNLDRIEATATTKLKMIPQDESVFLALPKEVSDMASTRIIPGREPAPTPVFPAF
jgi:cell division protein FtsL